MIKELIELEIMNISCADYVILIVGMQIVTIVMATI